MSFTTQFTIGALIMFNVILGLFSGKLSFGIKDWDLTNGKFMIILFANLTMVLCCYLIYSIGLGVVE